MSFFSKKSKASSSSLDVNPNLLASPPLSSHLPLPLEANLMRMPMLGRTFNCLAMRAMRFSSFSFSTTRKMRLPIFCVSKASSMKSSSLYPLHTTNESGSVFNPMTA